MKKDFAHYMHRRTNRKKGDVVALAAQLAPLEEQEVESASKQLGVTTQAGESPDDPQVGTIVVDNANLNLPRDLVEGQGGKTFLGMEPVVLVILLVMLAWIAFIAWQISQMPAQ